MLYQIHERYMGSVSPINSWMNQLKGFCNQPWSPLYYTFAGKTMAATAEVIERCTGVYGRPEFNIEYANIDGNKIAIKEDIVISKPYCNLLNFKRNGQYSDQPKLLLIAPMSGHYSTLLRGTVEHFIEDHDVYITDWVNARDVPLNEGSFSFDDYVSYIIEFCQFLEDFHIVAVCQPTVPTIVAVSVMAEQNAKYQPKSMSLLGGPIDTRINPTEVNDYAISKQYEWFENNVICTVPDNYQGSGQKVYPGFIQLSGFLSMNLNSHIHKEIEFFGDLVKGDGESAEAHRTFYNEYLAVMDMPAEFYLDTIRSVFLEHQLPEGTITYKGKLVDSSAVKRVALMTVEGENDDITGTGQTQAAHQILSGIASDMKQHYVQPDVGHYGVFNGRRFREEIGPKIKQFIQAHN